MTETNSDNVTWSFTRSPNGTTTSTGGVKFSDDYTSDETKSDKRGNTRRPK